MHTLRFTNAAGEREELDHPGPWPAAVERFHGKVGARRCVVDGEPGSFAMSCGKMQFIKDSVSAFFAVRRPRG